MRSLPACLLLPLLMSSCIIYRNDVNEPLKAERIAKLRPGVTSAQDALNLLGAPADVIQLGKRTAWYYEHVRSKTSGFWALLVVLSSTDTRSDRLWLFFDEKGVLRHAGSTLAAERSGYRLPWSNPHAGLADKAGQPTSRKQ